MEILPNLLIDLSKHIIASSLPNLYVLKSTFINSFESFSRIMFEVVAYNFIYNFK